MGAHNRVYVIGTVNDWIAYNKRTKGSNQCRLLANPLAAANAIIYPWDRIHYGQSFHRSKDEAMKSAMMSELRRAAERGRRVEM